MNNVESRRGEHSASTTLAHCPGWTPLLLSLVMLLLPKSNALVVPTPPSFQLTKKPTPVTVPWSLFYQTSPPFPASSFQTTIFKLSFSPIPSCLPLWNKISLCRSGKPQSHRDLSDLASHVMWLRHATQLRYCFLLFLSFFKMFCIWWSSFKWNYLRFNISNKNSPNKTLWNLWRYIW